MNVMQDKREDLYKKVQRVISKVREARMMPIYGSAADDFHELATYRMVVDKVQYAKLQGKFSQFTDDLLDEMVSVITESLEAGLEPMSYHGTKIMLWMRSSLYVTDKQSKEKLAKYNTYIDDYNVEISSDERFTFGRLFDCLLQLSHARKVIERPLRTRTWKKPRGSFYRKKDLSYEYNKTFSNFKAGWDAEKAIILINKDIHQALQFAYKYKMESLIKILSSIKHIEPSKAVISPDSMSPLSHYHISDRLKNLKRIDAAIDDLFVHIYKRKFDVTYACDQVGRTKDGTFNCRREFHTPTHSLLNCGNKVDGLSNKSAFYSLFTLKSYDDLVQNLSTWFQKVPA